MNQENKDKNITYIAEGSFGCLFNSEIQCQTQNPFQNIKDKRRYVSKVKSAEDQTRDREMHIGNMIKNIKQHDYYFAPILDTCPINIGVIDNEEIEKCHVITKKEAKQEKNSIPNIYVSNKMRFVGDNTVTEYLETKFDNQKIKAIFETHLHLIKSLDKLLSQPEPIIHYDLKSPNIMLDSIQNVPIIIDFGLSFTSKNIFDSLMKPEILVSFFYNDESYSPWSIEVQLLSFITINIISNDEDFEELYVQKYFDDFNDIVYNFTITETNETIFDSEDERIHFRQNMNEYITSFKVKTIKEFFIDLLNTWKSWDNYAVAVMYKTFLQNSELLSDPYIIKYIDLLKSIILATPSTNGGRPRAEPREIYKSIIELCSVNPDANRNK